MKRIHRRRGWGMRVYGLGFFLVMLVVSMALLLATSGAGAPPPPGGPLPPAAEIVSVGPVGVPQVSSSVIDPGSSWIEWQTGWGGERPFIRSSSPSTYEVIFRSGALGKVIVVGERKGATFFAQDYFPSVLLPSWQKEFFEDPPMRVEFLPGVKISVLTATGWRLGSLEDIEGSFSINEGIPTAQGIIALRVSVP